MVSRENKVIIACIALAIGLLYVVTELTTIPQWAFAAIGIGIGVVVPTLINEYLDRSR